MTPADNVCGLILAGGKARRFGEDKRFADLAGRSLIDHAISRLQPQVGELVLSSNDPIPNWENLVHLADQRAEQGPLLGIAEGLAFAKDEGYDWLITAPADSPFLPHNLAQNLLASSQEVQVRFAESQGRRHPVFGAWPSSLASDLFAVIASGERKIDRAADSIGGYTTCAWDDDPFFNVNRTDDLAEAERLYAASKASS